MNKLCMASIIFGLILIVFGGGHDNSIAGLVLVIIGVASSLLKSKNKNEAAKSSIASGNYSKDSNKAVTVVIRRILYQISNNSKRNR